MSNIVAILLPSLGRSDGPWKNLTANNKVWFASGTSIPISSQVC